MTRLLFAAERVGRLLVAGLFVHEAITKLGHVDAALAYMAAHGLPAMLLWPAIALELVGGASIALGVAVVWTAPALASFSVATAVIFHHALGETNQLLHFEKDLAIAGGLMVIAAGATKAARCRAAERSPG